MSEEVHCSKCGALLSADTKETMCPQCITPRQAPPVRRLCGALLLLLAGVWTLFWGMAVAISIAALDKGGGREAVGDAVGGGMMGLIGLFVFTAGIFMLRTAKKPSEHSERKSLFKRSILGGLIGYAVVSTVLMPVIPILNASRMPEQPQVDQGLVRATLFLALNGLPVVGAILGVIVARRMKTRNPADRPRKGIPIARSVVAGLVGTMASFMTWLFLPPILILAGLYRILGLPYTYEDLDGFNLSMVSGVMLAIGAALGIIAARRMDSEKEPASAEHVDGGAGPDSSTTQPTASLWHRRYPVMLIAACMFCLAAILFWKNAPGTSPALKPSIGVQPGEERTFAGITFCWCPPGSFTMGSPDPEAGRTQNEGPQHAVTFQQGFWMSKCEVTHAQWKAIDGFHPEAMKGDENLPMQMVDWYECQSFLRRLSRQGAGTFRLPSGGMGVRVPRRSSDTVLAWRNALEGPGPFGPVHAQTCREFSRKRMESLRYARQRPRMVPGRVARRLHGRAD